MSVEPLVVSPVSPVEALNQGWGWLILFLWSIYQFYWPFWSTKVQTVNDALTTRLRNIEVTQIAIAEHVETVSAQRVRELHERDNLDPDDLKHDPYHGKGDD